MGLRLLEGPDGDVVSLAEAKAHLRVDGSDENALIEGLIAAATSHLDGAPGVLGRCLLEQRWAVSWDEFDDVLNVPLAPVLSIDAVHYVDGDGVSRTLDDVAYSVLLVGGARIHSDNWPATARRPGAVTVEFTAGYGDAADVPQPIKQAILLLVGHWYANREAVNVGNMVTPLPMAVEALTLPYVYRVL